MFGWFKKKKPMMPETPTEYRIRNRRSIDYVKAHRLWTAVATRDMSGIDADLLTDVMNMMLYYSYFVRETSEPFTYEAWNHMQRSGEWGELQEKADSQKDDLPKAEIFPDGSIPLYGNDLNYHLETETEIIKIIKDDDAPVSRASDDDVAAINRAIESSRNHEDTHSSHLSPHSHDIRNHSDHSHSGFDHDAGGSSYDGGGSSDCGGGGSSD